MVVLTRMAAVFRASYPLISAASGLCFTVRVYATRSHSTTSRKGESQALAPARPNLFGDIGLAKGELNRPVARNVCGCQDGLQQGLSPGNVQRLHVLEEWPVLGG